MIVYFSSSFSCFTSQIVGNSAIRGLPSTWSIYSHNLFLQEQELQILREHTFITFKTLSKKNRRVWNIMSTSNNYYAFSQNLQVDSHHSVSNN